MKSLNIIGTALAVMLSGSVATVTSEQAVQDKHLKQAQAVFSWVAETEGSYIHPNQEVRRMVPGDIDTPLGVFATDTIQEGETLAKVPWANIIASSDPEDESEQLPCGLVVILAKELELGDKSKYAPYVAYLNDEAYGQIPTSWTDDALDLMLEIIDEKLAPEDQIDWFREASEYCKVDYEDDPWIRKAILLIIQRSDDEIMIPAYDSYNHRNGNWTNTRTHCEPGEYHETKARKRIEKGEQILLSYYQSHFYGTAEMLRDYGFVEFYPQRWHYTEEEYHFNLDYDENDQVKLTWDDDYNYNPFMDANPKEVVKARDWFQKEIMRLRGLRPRFESNTYEMPSSQFDQNKIFLEANILAMELAKESIDAHLLEELHDLEGDDEEEDDDEEMATDEETEAEL
ncbi:MAG: hypothetical protein SGARI_003764 [Bacillariaceae sp.]